jgi:hypothetical protein
MDPAALAGVGVAFVAGVLLGLLLARRGERLHIDWRLQIRREEGLSGRQSPAEPEEPQQD